MKNLSRHQVIPMANCETCKGKGCVPVQICCGQYVVGAEYMGAQEMICCGDPDEDVETCPKCKGSGEVDRAAVSEGDSR